MPFVIFLIAATAELNRPPFDLVEAEQELVGGFHTEYSSIRFALFFLAEFMNTITMSAIIVTLFLGGPSGPDSAVGPELAVGARSGSSLKLFVFLFIFVWFRATLPRFRYDQLMDLGWKLLIPLALGWLLLLAAMRVGPRRGLEPLAGRSASASSCCWSCWGLLLLAPRPCRQRRIEREPIEEVRCLTDGLPRRASRSRSSKMFERTRVTARRTRSEQARRSPTRLHGRHVLNRYEDGMEKCIGCELCAGVCPARCIYVRGADNPPDDPVSPGERYGFVYEINYLRCIHCDLCVEACPTEAITESKLFEFSFTNRQDAIYTKAELVVDDDGKPQQLPWEDWRDGRRRAHVGLDAGHRAVAATPPTRAGWRGRASSATACGRPSRASPADAPTADRRRTAAPTRPTADDGRRTTDHEAHDATVATDGLVVFVVAGAVMLAGAVGVVICAQPGALRAHAW